MVFPKLKPLTKTISLRLPESMLDQIRLLANKRDVPYQSLIKVFCRSESTRNSTDRERVAFKAIASLRVVVDAFTAR